MNASAAVSAASAVLHIGERSVKFSKQKKSSAKMLISTRLSHRLSQCMLPVAMLFLLQPRRCGSGAVSMHGYSQPSTERCVIHAPVNGSMLHLNEDMEIREEHRFARVTCLLEEDRWEQDACRISFQAAGERGPWMSLPWSSPYTQHSVQVNGTVWTRFPMWFELADNVPGYMTVYFSPWLV